jgi:hypothetical protein
MGTCSLEGGRADGRGESHIRAGSVARRGGGLDELSVAVGSLGRGAAGGRMPRDA